MGKTELKALVNKYRKQLLIGGTRDEILGKILDLIVDNLGNGGDLPIASSTVISIGTLEPETILKEISDSDLKEKTGYSYDEIMGLDPSTPIKIYYNMPGFTEMTFSSDGIIKVNLNNKNLADMTIDGFIIYFLVPNIDNDNMSMSKFMVVKDRESNKLMYNLTIGLVFDWE